MSSSELNQKEIEATAKVHFNLNLHKLIKLLILIDRLDHLPRRLVLEFTMKQINDAIAENPDAGKIFLEKKISGRSPTLKNHREQYYELKFLARALLEDIQDGTSVSPRS